MMPFEDLLNELGEFMGISLKVDPNQTCLLNFQNDVRVQIELSASADTVLVGCDLGSIAPGAFRERILRQAMKVNSFMTLQRGALAYSQRKGSLILFQILPLPPLTAEKLFHFLLRFEDHARIWKQALASGSIPELERETRTQSSGFYGLR